MATHTIPSPCPLAYSIYGLLDPRTENIYYVGQTTNMTNRLYAHLSSGRKTNNSYQVPVNVITQQILEAGMIPQSIKLDEITTPHKELVLRLEECWRLEMLSHDEVLSNAWKTGRCVDTDNPMAEAEYVKGYALATDEQIAELRESDKVRALQKVFG
jgi:hypothetical protein